MLRLFCFNRLSSGRGTHDSQLHEVSDKAARIHVHVSRFPADHRQVRKPPSPPRLFDRLNFVCCRDVFPYGIYMYTYVNVMHSMKQFLVVTEQNLSYLPDVQTRRVDARRVESFWLTVLAGSLAGILSWMVVIPFDVMKTKMQADDTYTSSWHCVRENYTKHGWRSMFRGGYMVLMRAIPFNAAMFVGYEWAINKCQYVVGE